MFDFMMKLQTQQNDISQQNEIMKGFADQLYKNSLPTPQVPMSRCQGIGEILPAHGDAWISKGTTFIRENFWQPYKIASAYIEKLSKWPDWKSEDNKAVHKFAIFLVCCKILMKDNAHPNKFDSVDFSPVYMTRVFGTALLNYGPRARNFGTALLNIVV